ncbi:general secretion pathway protein GspC, partial [Pseudomonas simiae]|nr:general secretion pathway protein GspC [Pseudomonas simiae]
MTFAHRFTLAHGVQALGVLAALAGVAVLTPLLLTRAESPTPQATPPAFAARRDNPAFQWFSNTPTALPVQITGLLAGA